MVVRSVKVTVVFGHVMIKGRSLSVMAHLKRSIIEVRAEQNCLAHALILAIAELTNDPNYNSYRHRYKVRTVVNHLLETTGIGLKNGGVVPELLQYQEHFQDYRIVFVGLDCEDIVFLWTGRNRKEN
jgi:hypothetical protein